MTWPLGADSYPLPPEILAYVNLGAFVLFFMLGLRGYIWLRPSVDELKENIKEIRAENVRLNQMAREAWVPALTKATDANVKVAESFERLDDQLRALEGAQRRLEEEVRRWGWRPPQNP